MHKLARVVLDIDEMKFISIFETVTKIDAKDCFKEEGRITFVVKENEIGMAIGKGGNNIRKLERLLNKRIRVIEFNPDVLRFVQNVIMPLKVREIKEGNGIITIIPPDSQTRGYLIGRAASNLRHTEEIVKRYFKDIKELRVV